MPHSNIYTTTEKKRLRKVFGKQKEIMEIPNLINVQIESYKEFLQQGVPVEKRNDVGLHGALQSVFPMESYMQI